MLGKAKLSMFFLMAIQTRLWIAAGIVNKDGFATACLNVFAPRTVTRFAATDLVVGGLILEKSRVNASRELPGDFCMAILALVVPYKMCPFDLWRDDHGTGYGST